MTSDAWISMTSLIGVAIGGTLSFLVQHTTSRAAHRADQSRQRVEVAEARRAQGIEVLVDFIRSAQQAERLAEERVDQDSDWQPRAQDAMDTVWIGERMIYLLFGADVNRAAHDYANALSQALWADRGERPLWESLRPSKLAFLAAAHDRLV